MIRCCAHAVPDKKLTQEALEVYLDGGFNEEAVIKQVTNGKGAMPSFGSRLSEEDVAEVAVRAAPPRLLLVVGLSTAQA